MPFEPRSGGHAIIEAVFGLGFGRAFTPEEIERVAAHHSEFRKALPKLSRGAGFQFSFGGSAFPSQVAMPGMPVSFDRMKANGDFEWRLRAEGQAILLNCLSYSRWGPIWKTASSQLARIAELAGAEGNPVTSIILQYVDLFDWKGALARYDVNDLLEVGGDIIPKGISDKGPWWHLHQGWFKTDREQLPGRTLERVHIDAVIDNGTQKPTVRIDIFMSVDLPEGTFLQPGALKKGGNFATWFDEMHRVHKQILSSLLSDVAAKRIGLNV